MRVFFDTSVLVAALLEGHPRHPQAFPWLRRALDREITFLVATHSLAELYSTLTGLPIKPKISPSAARQLIAENIEPAAELVSLVPEDYSSVLEQLSARGLAGGIVYDALLVRAAEKAGAERLLTFNAKDFLRIWPDGGSVVLVPE